MASRTIRFKDNELYDPIHELLATFQAGERAPIAYEALKKLNAIGTPTVKIGRFQKMTMRKEDGPKEVVLLESERDVALDAVKAWSAPTFDVPLKDAAIALLLNAKGD